jgi:hypothetical protein
MKKPRDDSARDRQAPNTKAKKKDSNVGSVRAFEFIRGALWRGSQRTEV